MLGELTGEASSSLDAAQNDLNTVSDELAQLYHHVCTVNGETPSRVLLDHEKHSKPGNLFFFKTFFVLRNIFTQILFIYLLFYLFSITVYIFFIFFFS